MIIRLTVLLIIVVLFIIGYVKIKNEQKAILTKIDFLIEFNNQFTNLVNSCYEVAGFLHTAGINQKLYRWLSMNSNKAQRAIGAFGIGDVRGPFNSYQARNYQFIVNVLPKFQGGLPHIQEAAFVESGLLSSIGYYQEKYDTLKLEQTNPLKWFQYGVQFLLGLPIAILVWFGILSYNKLDFLEHSSIFKFTSGVIALISFFSSIVTIVTGWNPFVSIISRFAH
jgi:hypothetical protein